VRRGIANSCNDLLIPRFSVQRNTACGQAGHEQAAPEPQPSMATLQQIEPLDLNNNENTMTASSARATATRKDCAYS
jgi:hypothetical protein